MLAGYVCGYTMIYDNHLEVTRGCGNPFTYQMVTISFEDGEIITGFDIFKPNIISGITIHTTRGTYGHFGPMQGTFVTVSGYNLEYIYGKVGWFLDDLAFHFTRC